MQTLFEQHSDHPIFASLPGAGQFLAPALLCEFGDDQARFASPASLQPLAGTCPVTDQSGKRKLIKFRRGCDHEFRWIVQQWARNSLKESVWTNAYWQQVRPQYGSDNHAYKSLDRRTFEFGLPEPSEAKSQPSFDESLDQKTVNIIAHPTTKANPQQH